MFGRRRQTAPGGTPDCNVLKWTCVIVCACVCFVCLFLSLLIFVPHLYRYSSWSFGTLRNIFYHAVISDIGLLRAVRHFGWCRRLGLFCTQSKPLWMRVWQRQEASNVHCLMRIKWENLFQKKNIRNVQPFYSHKLNVIKEEGCATAFPFTLGNWVSLSIFLQNIEEV